MKPLLFLFLTGILCACTLSEQADMEINLKPTLVVEYRYIRSPCCSILRGCFCGK